MSKADDYNNIMPKERHTKAYISSSILKAQTMSGKVTLTKTDFVSRVQNKWILKCCNLIHPTMRLLKFLAA